MRIDPFTIWRDERNNNLHSTKKQVQLFIYSCKNYLSFILYFLIIILSFFLSLPFCNQRKIIFYSHARVISSFTTCRNLVESSSDDETYNMRSLSKKVPRLIKHNGIVNKTPNECGGMTTIKVDGKTVLRNADISNRSNSQISRP